MPETIYLVIFQRSSYVAYTKYLDAVKAASEVAEDFGYKEMHNNAWYNYDNSVLVEVVPVELY